MTRSATLSQLRKLADSVLLACFDGTTIPAWLGHRLQESLGGVCLFGRNIGTSDELYALTSALAAARAGVVISVDEEAGDVTRLDVATGSRFPGQAAIGRVDDIDVTRKIGRETAELLARNNITLNFAPVADLADDPSNPVIGTRSFGSSPSLVARHTAAFIQGHQDAGVSACAKHFPGHGATGVDTHLELAVIPGTLDQIMATALPPFQAAIAAGVDSIMMGHLQFPGVDSLPASVSRRWITDILRSDLGFSGVVVTDALEMAAIAGPYGIGEGAVMALQAGADLLCLGGENATEATPTLAREAIVAAVLDGRLSQDRLREAADRCVTVGTLASVAESGRERIVIKGSSAGATVADLALQIIGPLPALEEPVLILRCADRPNIAVGSAPWGPATQLLAAVEYLLGDSDLAGWESDLAAAGTVLVVTRDRHRHSWMQAVIDRVRKLRVDAVVVEMGLLGVVESDAPAIASFGASAANTAAILRALKTRERPLVHSAGAGTSE